MPPEENIYASTVELLSDLSGNHAAAAADMAAHAAPLDPTAADADAVEDLGAVLRRLEDVAIAAVCRLARTTDEETAFSAIDEAGAGWLRGVILNRAAETLLGGFAR
jgi:hypothetical protein